MEDSLWALEGDTNRWLVDVLAVVSLAFDDFRGDRDRLGCAIAVDGHFDVATCRAADKRHSLGVGRDLGAIDLLDYVSSTQPCTLCRAGASARLQSAVGPLCRRDALYRLNARSHFLTHVGQTPRHCDEVKNDESNDEVHRHPTEHHDNALPPRLLVHGVGLFGRIDWIHCGHACDVAESAKRNCLYSILGVMPSCRSVMPLEGKQRWAEANEVPTHSHSTQSSCGEMAPFVKGDCHRDADCEE